MEIGIATYAVTELAANKAAATGKVRDFMMSEDVRMEALLVKERLLRVKE